jgi:hypothetical protein
MAMKRNRNLIVGILLAATVGLLTLQSRFAPSTNNAPLTPSATSTFLINPTDTITLTLTIQTCGYMWAYHDAPELTDRINTFVRDLNGDASARAELFGEDCIHADGSSTFGVMETDFYVQVPVDNLTDEEAFGNWIAKVLSFVVDFPKDQIQGNYGFVEFSFTKSDTERITLRLPIQQYINVANGKTGAELFRFFNMPPTSPT